MDASFVELRTQSKKILAALDRNEPVTLYYRGKRKGVIEPVGESRNRTGDRPRVQDSPAFGMWADREEMADPSDYVRLIRKSRFDDL